MFCDLHIHSTASDGTDAPEALPRLALEAGLSAIALTDHDTASGVEACAAAASAAGVAFVPGIELSADPSSIQLSQPRGTLHILGYFIRPDAPRLLKVQQRLLKARAERNPEMVDRLNELGVRISYDEVVARAGGEIVGRPHIAQVMVDKGYVRSIHEAFSRYIGEGGAAFVRKDRLPAAEAIATIHDAGGLACLAHPVQLRLDEPDELDHLVARLKTDGLDAIETRHSDHTPADVQRFEALAKRFDLLAVGGSDYHGSRKSTPLGASRVPLTAYEALLAAQAARA